MQELGDRVVSKGELGIWKAEKKEGEKLGR
jgi:hypothetical protein